MRHVVVVLVLCSTLTACAPVALTRTPEPAEVGKTETTLSLGYAASLTAVTVCQGEGANAPLCPLEGLAPAYWPDAQPVTFMSAWGVAANKERNVSIFLSEGPGVRFGEKALLQGSSPAFSYAIDYGMSLYLTNLELDGGLILGTPVGQGVDIYGALRGYGMLYWTSGAGGAASLTLGAALPNPEGQGRVFVEVSALLTHYNRVGPTEAVQPFGFALVPAVGVQF